MKKFRIQPTRLDKAIAAIAPGWGASRLRARGQMEVMALTGSYVGARKDRRETQNWSVSGGSADADILWDLPTLRERSRDLVRNAPLATGAINTLVTNVVGTGLVPKARIDRAVLGLEEDAADAWETAAERIFRQWAFGPYGADVTREMNFMDLQQVAIRSTAESGDVFFVRRFTEQDGGMLGFRWQVVEGDRVCNPDNSADTRVLRGGVQKDEQGRVTAYHMLDQHPGDYQIGLASRTWTTLPAWARDGSRQVSHLYRMLRPGQSRGVPFLAPVLEAFKQLDAYREAEQMAAVVAAMLTVFVKTQGSEGFGVSFPSDPNNALSSNELKLGRGAIVDLAPGEDVEVVNPGRPNQAFDPFMNAILTQIGAALEIPLELLTKRFNSSYSASRAALLEAWKAFKTQRFWLAQKLCVPSYEAVITEAVARGYLDAPGFFDDPEIRHAWLQHDWIGPAPGNIDPLKEVQAARERIEGNLSTHDKETAELTGGDWERDHRQLAKEIKQIEADGTAPKPKAQANPAMPDQPDPTNQDNQP